ncbi:PREDICTED: spermatid maturation protein 1 [Colobus angolensis palliatus]|uniref:Spermatid maturation protein 1 N-terminal domain-containing protein n=1 Tax=Colobus angolensis palliatus TaxID=336983 RepID=A0A2K5J1C4_COLAP|nr:PREDICTED: spermatid maturation protein 1 [Colobus angolensis palliatus]
MAMAERPRPEWASYHNCNTNSCQDLGNSVLLLLGLIICINISINIVTLLWSRFRGVLYQVFHDTICEKEAPKSSSLGKQTQPSKKQSSPAVHLRCTMDPVKMTVTPPPARRHRRRGSPTHCAHCPVAWAPDTDDEKPYQYPAICSYHWEGPKDWEGFQRTQGTWVPWTQDPLEPPPQTIRFQPTIEERPLKTDMRSELGLRAYVYSVNPPPPSPEAPSHKNSGEEAVPEAEAAQYQPVPAPILGPAVVPEFSRCHSSGRIVYDARDVRRRLQELTREVEALSRCYPLASGSSTAEGTSKNWVYRSLTGR